MLGGSVGFKAGLDWEVVNSHQTFFLNILFDSKSSQTINQDSDFYVLVSLGHMDNCMDVCVFAAAAAAKSLQSCPTLWPHRWQPTRLPRPWDSPGKNTGVGCHFLLQCMKVKSESEVAQLCPNLSDHMDYSPPGSSIHGIVQARGLERGAIAFSVCVYSKL